jgi:hypothetical protein
MKPRNVTSTTTEALGANQERDRLTWRARRVTAVIAALKQQAGEQQATAQGTGRHMHQAIREFEAEVAAIDARLRDLKTGANPAGSPRDRDRRAI